MTNIKRAILEVCAFHIDSCMIAERAGAARIELCDNPIEGGTTPSYGTIKMAREKISILLYPILRPKLGNYYYNDIHEFTILKEDIDMCKQLGCDGISVGVRKKEMQLLIQNTQSYCGMGCPMGVTCNRVFDCAPDPFEALGRYYKLRL